MKIAMLGHKRVPSREGGVEIVVQELATRMAALGHDVVLLNRTGHNVAGSEFDSERLSEYEGVRIKYVPTVDVKGLAAVSASFFATLGALKERPDVIHFHAEGPCLMIPLAKLAGVRVVATIHGLDWMRAKWGKLASWVIKTGEKNAAKYADEVIVLSDNVKRYFKDTYGREVRFIPNGVSPVERVRPEIISDAYGLDEGSYLLYLGRIVPEKGVHYLIEAFKDVATDKKLVIAGGSSDSQDYFDSVKQMAAGDDRIVFAGFVEGQKLAELYSNACVYVLPSDVEGMPLSLLEAMAFGRCCLTSDIPECQSVVSDCGVTFSAGDVSALREAIEKLLADDASRQEMGEKARELVYKKFDWDVVVEKTLSLYREEAENGRF